MAVERLGAGASLLAAAALAFAAGPAPAALSEEVLFHCTFENGWNAAVARGAPQAAVEGDVAACEGRNGGRAAHFAARGDLLRFAAAGNLPAGRGAVGFWLKESRVPDGGRVWNPYFQVLGKAKCALNILRPWQPFAVAAGLWEAGAKQVMLSGEPPPVDEWVHVLVTWRRHELRFYVNGAEVDRDDDLTFSPPAEPASFTLGRPQAPARFADPHHTGLHLLKDAPDTARKLKIGKEPYGAFALDDVIVLDRFVGPRLATALAGDLSPSEALAQAEPDTPSLSVKHYLNAGKVRVNACFFSRGAGALRATAAVVDAAGKERCTVELKHGAGGLDMAMLDVGGLPVGRYSVEARLLDGERVAARTPPEQIVIEAPAPWLANTYGAEDVVLPGLEPLRASPGTVTVWGREYRFGQAPLPTQIVNQGAPMLAGPITWRLRTAETTSDLAPRALALESVSDTRAVLRGQAVLGPFQVRTETVVEYDGFIKSTITFLPGDRPVTVDALWMEIPLRPEACSLLFYPTRRDGRWPGDWSAPLDLVTTGMLTVGTPDVCLQWITESDQHYFPRGGKTAIRTEDRANARALCTNVISAPKQVTAPFTLTFALEAGPVRSRPANWRGWTSKGRRYLDPERHFDASYVYDWWSTTPGQLIPRQGFPATPDPTLLQGAVRETSLHFQGFRHFDETDVDAWLPEWRRYGAEWERVPRQISVGQSKGWNHIYVDTNSSWGQYHIHNCWQLFTLTGMRGLYYDDWSPGLSLNEAAGSGYVDEQGVRRPIHPVFSQREIHRRIYAIVKRKRPDDGFVMIHTSGLTLLPIVAFCDLFYDGEIMGWVDRLPPQGDYFTTYRNDLFQAIFCGRQYGPIPGFHDMTTSVMNKTQVTPVILKMSNQRKLWAMLLTHDIHYLAGFTSGSEELLFFWLDHFGIAEPDVRFHPYWGARPAVRALRSAWKDGATDGASRVWAVAYTRPGRALVVAVRDAPNNYCGPANVEVRLDRTQLGLPNGPLRVTDLETLGRAPKGAVEGDLLRVPVDASDFAAVVLEAAARQ